jgi:hypothetical protein
MFLISYWRSLRTAALMPEIVTEEGQFGDESGGSADDQLSWIVQAAARSASIWPSQRAIRFQLARFWSTILRSRLLLLQRELRLGRPVTLATVEA